MFSKGAENTPTETAGDKALPQARGRDDGPRAATRRKRTQRSSRRKDRDGKKSITVYMEPEGYDGLKQAADDIGRGIEPTVRRALERLAGEMERGRKPRYLY